MKTALAFVLVLSWHAGFIRPQPGHPVGGYCTVSPEGVDVTEQLPFGASPVKRHVDVRFNAAVPGLEAVAPLVQAAAAGPFVTHRGIPDVGQRSYKATAPADASPVVLGEAGMFVTENRAAAAETLRKFIDENCAPR